MLSRNLQFSSLSLFCRWLGLGILVKILAENWVWVLRMLWKLVLEWQGLLWLWCCWLLVFFFNLLCLGFITWLSGGALLSKDVTKLKSGTHWHLGCWNDAENFPEGCCRFAQLSLWNLALDSGIFSIKQSLSFFFFKTLQQHGYWRILKVANYLYLGKVLQLNFKNKIWCFCSKIDF